MKQFLARQKTNRLDDAVAALWDRPEDLLLIRRELLRRRTRGAAILRTRVDARLAEFVCAEPSAGALEGSSGGPGSDVAALKRQISFLLIEIADLRKMAGFNHGNAHLYARVGAVETIQDFALDAMREANRNKFRKDATDESKRETSDILFRYYEDAFDKIDLLRSEQR
jgi:hypothetical protein